VSLANAELSSRTRTRFGPEKTSRKTDKISEPFFDIEVFEPRPLVVSEYHWRKPMPNQGGSHDQHVKAGQQSHKNIDQKQASSSSNDRSPREGGGSHEQQVKAGQKSHKNS
jgi:hypothetical protein